ncbi:MAG: hemolysin III family protein [Isosphaeraceae bacterium]
MAMGWGSVVCYSELARAASRRVLRPLVEGGAYYSIGAIINLAGWPRPWPGVVGSHELFHLLVIAGSMAHFRLMLDVVIPFRSGDDVGAVVPVG